MWLSNDISLLIMASYIRLTYQLHASDVALPRVMRTIFSGVWMDASEKSIHENASKRNAASFARLASIPFCACRSWSDCLARKLWRATLKLWAIFAKHPKLLKWRWQLFWFIHELELQFPFLPLAKKRWLNWGFWFFCQSMLKFA